MDKHIPLAFALIVLLMPAMGLADPPQLIESNPANGAKGVPVDIGKVVLSFDRNMKTRSWSLMESEKGPFPPMRPRAEPWVDPLTFEFEIKTLKPATTYAIQLNSRTRKGFASAEDGTPLPPTTIVFTTAPQEGAAVVSPRQTHEVQPPRKEEASREVAIETGNAEAEQAAAPPAARVQSRIQPGWRFRVTRAYGMKGTEIFGGNEKLPFRMFQKIVFEEEVEKSAAGRVREALRRVETADLHSLDPDQGRMVKEQLVPAGTRFRVSYGPSGTVLRDAASGEEIWDTDLIEAFSPPMVPRLWPKGELEVGQEWRYRGEELARRIALIDTLGGELKLRVEEIKADPQTGLQTAYLRGTLRTKIDLESVILDFDAKAEIDLPLSVGVPFLVKFEGRLSGGGKIEDENGRLMNYTLEGEGAVSQVAEPAKAVLEAAAGESAVPQEEGIDTKGALRVPLSGWATQDDSYLIRRPPPDKAQLDERREAYNRLQQQIPKAMAGKESGHRPAVYHYTMYEDRTEKAFTVLVPKGWETKGGIMQIPPNQVRTVVDAYGKKMRFSVYDPASQAAVEYFPTEMFHTLTGGVNYLPMAPGQVLNGMIQMPRVLSPAEYIVQVVFPSERQDVRNVEWGKRESRQDLANAWFKAFHSQDEIKPRITSETIEVYYDLNGRRYKEVWVALITALTVNTSTIWTPDFTVALRAPADEVDKYEPLLRTIVTSFRIDSTWFAKAVARFKEGTEKVRMTQEQIRKLDRAISDHIRKVQSEVRRIDNEILASRSSTRENIQKHEYNTLMGLWEYEDPETGKRATLDMGWERTFTNGEHVIQTNDWQYEPPPDYRDMTTVWNTDE